MKKHARNIRRRFKAGYVHWNEYVSPTGKEEDAFWVITVWTPDEKYIGQPPMGHRICVQWGIVPEPATPESNTCSIGFCEQDQKWYGWSHRSIFGFGIGHAVSVGSAGYLPASKEAFRRQMLSNWSPSEQMSARIEEGKVGPEGAEGIKIEWDKHDDIMGIFHPYPEKWGRGTWVAETPEDCKQMAIDYAGGVS